MKKLAIVASLVAAFGSVGMAQAASSGTITFNGELTANTCDVVVDGQTADATVVLPTVGVNQLNSATKTAGDTGFVMALNNCSGTLQTASAYFEAGASVDSLTGRLKNLTGSATNVSLQLLDGSSASQAIIQAGNANQVMNTTYKDVSGGSTTLPYTVRYYAEAPTTAGTVVSNVVYSIQYQ
ncbi:Major pilin [Serratia fonticola]|uniref:fimbrial protein n=1 Tax=Serratia fonticola TaxID=47917 RepID=UPI001646BE2A|nr:fimbrial protein [Serratia fonticola]MBC3232036.1 type 1 fimbrial protein [Serratia fonticola]CAI1996623.1 Major pilin [Serratia fonticola]